MKNPHERRERENGVTTATSLSHRAAQKLEEATAFVRRVEADLLTMSELVLDAEALGVEAGLELRVGMSPEAGAAFRAYKERPDAERVASSRDPLENIPTVLR